MGDTAAPEEQQPKNAQETHKTRDRVIQGIIVLVFAAIEQFYVDENFKCPCFDNVTEENCHQAKTYSTVFITMTTVGAGFVGFVILSAVNCVLTFGKKSDYVAKFNAYYGKVDIEHGTQQGSSGMRDVEQGGGGHEPAQTQVEHEPPFRHSGACINIFHGCHQKYCCRKFAEASLICFAWFSLLLIDGDYIACASICYPYGNVSCAQIRGLPQDELPYTLSFAQARRISQYVGIGLISVVVIAIALTKFCTISCKSCCTCGKCCCCCSCCCKKCCVCKYDKRLDEKRKGPPPEEMEQIIKRAAETAVNKLQKVT